MRILITGGAGFIGSNFVHYTLRHRPDAEITVLDALTYAGSRASLAAAIGQIEFVEGRVEAAAPVDRLVAASALVVHFAAESHNDNSIASPAPFVTTNVVGTFTLLEAVDKHAGTFGRKTPCNDLSGAAVTAGDKHDGFFKTQIQID